MKNTITAYLQLKNKLILGNPKIAFRCTTPRKCRDYTRENKQKSTNQIHTVPDGLTSLGETLTRDYLFQQALKISSL